MESGARGDLIERPRCPDGRKPGGDLPGPAAIGLQNPPLLPIPRKLSKKWQGPLSGEWVENDHAHERLGNLPMADHSPPILADRPEVGPCLRTLFRQAPSHDAQRAVAV
jgi:hypothetical protein